MTRRDERLELHNIPIPLTPEQRRTADLLRKRLRELAYGRGSLPIGAELMAPMDYSAIEVRMAHFYGYDKAVYAQLYGSPGGR